MSRVRITSETRLLLRSRHCSMGSTAGSDVARGCGSPTSQSLRVESADRHPRMSMHSLSSGGPGSVTQSKA